MDQAPFVDATRLACFFSSSANRRINIARIAGSVSVCSWALKSAMLARSMKSCIDVPVAGCAGQTKQWECIGSGRSQSNLAMTDCDGNDLVLRS